MTEMRREITGLERLQRLYKMLIKAYPKMDVKFIEEFEPILGHTFRKVAVFDGEGRQICDAIWQWGSYGYEENLLEFYNGGKPIGHIKERKAFNLFAKTLQG